MNIWVIKMNKLITKLSKMAILLLIGYIFGRYSINPYDINNDGNVDKHDLLLMQKEVLINK